MKSFHLIVFLFISYSLSAQYDTSLIRKAIDYLKTEDFEIAITTFTKSKVDENIKLYPAIRKRQKNYRKEEEERMNFWLRNCFISDSFYFIPDLSKGRFPHDVLSDSLSFRAFIKLPYKIPDFICNSYILIESFLLNTQTIELKHFSGVGNEKIKFGEINVLRLKLDAGKFQLIYRGDIILN